MRRAGARVAWALRGSSARAGTKKLLPQSRRVLQQFRHLRFPKLRMPRGAMPGRLIATGDQINAAVLHAFDLALQRARWLWGQLEWLNW